MALSSEELAIRQRLKDDFKHYAEKCLRIRTKEGSVSPLMLNKPQLYLHDRLEGQLAEKGYVRALILKGRQQGCSTYVEGRYYWKVTHRRGVRAFILTHEQEATNNLFEMAQRFHQNCPKPVKPHTSASNAKELIFDLLDSGYKVGTAGTKGTGRSSTLQYFHGSEVAFWPHAEDHAAGALQAVPKAAGTEIILESTANGLGNLFHNMWQRAEAGGGEYQAIFIPWFWQAEYMAEPPSGFSMGAEEAEYAEVYGLTHGQAYWKRMKIEELKGDESRFHQEYPATAALAFQTTGHDSYIPGEAVIRARKNAMAAAGPKVAGLDPARFGDDRTAYVLRQGRKVLKTRTWEKKDTMAIAGLAVDLLKNDGVDRLFVDVIGLGAGVYDRLVEMGYGDRVTAVNSSERPIKEDEYSNKRAEMAGEMRDWFLQPGGVDIPDEDDLHADLVAPGYSYDSHGRLKIEKKEDIKKRGLRSPDKGDALALTFAFPVAAKQMRSLSNMYPNRKVI